MKNIIFFIGLISISLPLMAQGPPAGFVLVEAGSFEMGLEGGETGEEPVHRVIISQSFYMSRYEVTQLQWREVMGEDQSRFRGDNLPMESVTWYDIVEYCNRLSENEGLTPCYSGTGKKLTCDFSVNGYRLPTEAEWEYAARGGMKSQGYMFSGSNSADEVGWHSLNSGGRTHPVGKKLPNELNLYDMSGNVWEWCWDWFGTYSASPETDPQGAAGGSAKVHRGGAFDFYPVAMGVTFRYRVSQAFRNDSLGFRPVRTAP